MTSEKDSSLAQTEIEQLCQSLCRHKRLPSLSSRIIGKATWIQFVEDGQTHNAIEDWARSKPSGKPIFAYNKKTIPSRSSHDPFEVDHVLHHARDRESRYRYTVGASRVPFGISVQSDITSFIQSEEKISRSQLHDYIEEKYEEYLASDASQTHRDELQTLEEDFDTDRNEIFEVLKKYFPGSVDEAEEGDHTESESGDEEDQDEDDTLKAAKDTEGEVKGDE